MILTVRQSVDRITITIQIGDETVAIVIPIIRTSCYLPR